MPRHQMNGISRPARAFAAPGRSFSVVEAPPAFPPPLPPPAPPAVPFGGEDGSGQRPPPGHCGAEILDLAKEQEQVERAVPEAAPCCRHLRDRSPGGT
jgi:hypothetical protein